MLASTKDDFSTKKDDFLTKKDEGWDVVDVLYNVQG